MNILFISKFIDTIVKVQLPDLTVNPELHNLVQTYQIHSHSKSCRKYKNIDCRYNFGRFFCDRSIVAEPLSKDLKEHDRNNILEKRSFLLNKVKDYINANLNPRTQNILDPGKPDYEEPKTISEILCALQIDEQDYYEALATSTDSDYMIHLARQPNSCFVNNYFNEGLISWKANMDIQPVFNHYKAVAYMCAYFSKSEDESTEAMQQAAKEARDMNKNNYEEMKSVSRAYANKREVSVQEAVYHVMPELWLRKTFPKVSFANSNLPENRYRMCKSKEEIDELPEDSQDVFKRNMIDRYIDRPNLTFKNGKYSIMDGLCFAEFLSLYYVAPKKLDDINDSQPEILVDVLLDENHGSCMLPNNVPLMSSKEVLKCRKVKAVLRYHVPNPHKNPEKYAHHILFMFYPFRNELELKSSSSETYAETLNDPIVCRIANENKTKFEPFADLVDNALIDFRVDTTNNLDPFAEQEDDEVAETLGSHINDEDTDEEPIEIEPGMSCIHNTTTQISADEICKNIRSLNHKQREIFEIINKWARDYTKNLSSDSPKYILPLHLFVTGGAGVGKSHLIKTLYQSLLKTLSYRCPDASKKQIMLIAPTGVAAVNIHGSTVHSELGIPVGRLWKMFTKT